MSSGTTVDGWEQVVVEFPDRRSAELAVIKRLRPALADPSAQWWFIRKFPQWRFRCPSDTHPTSAVINVVDELIRDGTATGCHIGVYEPEVHVFGGAAGMAVAHVLFHKDSRHVLDHLHRLSTCSSAADPDGPGRREVSVLLMSALLRAAGLDWYEQGDVWAKVADLRPTAASAPTSSVSADLRSSLLRLMTVEAGPTSPMATAGSWSQIAAWIAAFEEAGRHLAVLTARGELRRGLRAVLAHHVIFHWNRIGLHSADQHVLSHLATEMIMNTDTTPGASVSAAPEPIRLRNELVDGLVTAGTIESARVDAAMRAVPRHLFVPDAELAAAYADAPLYTKTDQAGVSISAASQPTIVAMMLEQLAVEPGHRVLELGAGTGYNAALLAHLAGPTGHVTTIDVDDDLVDSARDHLTAARTDRVEVLLTDGALGHPAGAPYDRIVATVGAWGIPGAWLDQLTPDGRLLVPLRIRGSITRTIAFQHRAGRWVSVSSRLSTFMPLRGIADDPRRIVDLTPGGHPAATVALHTHQDQHVDPAVLAGVLVQPRTVAWTGVTFGGQESMEWMDIWLTCTLPGGLSRMPANRATIDPDVVSPQFGWGSMATVEHDTLAYLTLRLDETSTGTCRHEVGVIAHGPRSQTLTDQVAQAIRTWNDTHRNHEAAFELHPTTAPAPDQADDAATDRFTIDTPLHRLVVSWPTRAA